MRCKNPNTVNFVSHEKFVYFPELFSSLLTGVKSEWN